VSLDVPIASLRGAGPVTAARLAERGVTTARDLLLRLPRGYDDLRRVTPIGELGAVADGTVVLVRGIVRRVHVFPRRLLDVFVEQDGAVVRARWFRPLRGMSKSFVKGRDIALAGPLRTGADGTRELVHPSNVTAAMAGAAAGGGGAANLGLRPRYAAVEGVNGRTLATLRQSALAQLGPDTQELLPAAARARLGLPTLAESLRRLHAPDDPGAADAAGAARDLAAARRRIALEALFVAQLAFVMRRAAAGRAVAFAPSPPWAAGAGARLEAALGFTLTASQRRALADITVDLGGARPMQRLLVGDVGSGKTAVALGAAAQVAAAGGQTLMMVPTEVLAEQQARALAPCAARLGFSVGLLTGGTGAAARATLVADAAAGRVALLVGTHALLADDVALPRLGLVIVDEQHRFGVSSRARLGRDERAGGSAPHLLSMSATPIPRSLALALHGDMDASFLVERPAGRAPVATTLCATAAERDAAYARLRDAVAAGGQAFVVCPVREVGRRGGAVTAVAQHARLARELRPARVGLLHGALSSADKDAALRAFASGATNVLVATTVVELGIDVPSATVMIVEGADRFGLAQLHQLRGRVGRGARPGACWLCVGDGPITDEARARLALVATTDDGFALAEADLAQRGAGDVYGTRQAGEAALAADSLAEMQELTALARGEAEALWSADPGLTAPAHAAAAAAARERSRTLYGGDAG
jgi:ATP-dependent DNA helicase RecG